MSKGWFLIYAFLQCNTNSGTKSTPLKENWNRLLFDLVPAQFMYYRITV